MTFEVTQKDINKGLQNSPESCPVAYAIKRKFHRWVSVADVYVKYQTSQNNMKYFDLPKKAVKFVERFDSGKKVKPFSFEIKKEKAVQMNPLVLY